MASRSKRDLQATTAISERVQSVLATKSLSLYRVSQESARLYGRSSPFFVPHNLYYDLRTGVFTPGIHQIAALSRISGYRLPDWLSIFGVNLEDVTHTQIVLPSKRTIVVDSTLTDPNEWIVWFRNRPGSCPQTGSLVPLAQLLDQSLPARIRSLSSFDHSKFVYANIGHEDALAFPELLPGSLVRIDSDIDGNEIFRENSSLSNRLFLIEHSKGFSCCRVRPIGDRMLVPISPLSYAQVELQWPSEAKIWGVIDLEILPLIAAEEPVIPSDLGKRWKPGLFPAPTGLGQTLRLARGKLNMSLREAAEKSHEISRMLNEKRYLISPSSLCDYERLTATPRDIHKIVSLCSIYGLRFRGFLQVLGIDVSEMGTEAMPDHCLSRSIRIKPQTNSEVNRSSNPGFLERLLEKFQEIPFFLRHSLESFAASARVSLEDFFWIGDERDPLHPYLEDGLLAIVNRRRKAAVHSTAKPWWQQPLYIILKRDGSYMAACCTAEDGMLVVHPYTRQFHRSAEFRLHVDAEVVGQILAIVKRVR